MKYAMFCSSATGNTGMLAGAIEEVLAGETKVEDPAEADLVCVGFWTDQGGADEKSRRFLKTLHDRRIFLFGTAGFGDSKTYFDGVLDAVEDNLNESNDVIGRFMCQGKMPQAIRDRYNKLKEEVPNQGAHYDLMISNFDKALTHPDQEDLARVKAVFKEAAAKL